MEMLNILFIEVYRNRKHYDHGILSSTALGSKINKLASVLNIHKFTLVKTKSVGKLSYYLLIHE